jgi:hypothetical protein
VGKIIDLADRREQAQRKQRCKTCPFQRLFSKCCRDNCPDCDELKVDCQCEPSAPQEPLEKDWTYISDLMEPKEE